MGEPVYAVGTPQGLELSLSEGIVSQLHGGPPPLIQTTVAISQGSSGGGLFNAEAELVGITTFYLKDAQSLNFALPVEWIDEVARRKTHERRIVAPKYPSDEEVVDAYNDIGVAFIKSGDYRKAIESLQAALRLKPDNADAWCNLGYAYGKMGRYREEIAAYREALRIKPDDADAWDFLAIAYAQSGNRSAALEAVKELRRYDPQQAEKLFNMIMKP